MVNCEVYGLFRIMGGQFLERNVDVEFFKSSFSILSTPQTNSINGQCTEVDADILKADISDQDYRNG